MRLLSALVLPVLALAAGCAQGGGDFPSLAPRPVERLSFEEPIRVDPAVTASPALVGQAAALLDRARAGDQAFAAAYASALPRVRAAGPATSDDWMKAQEAISRVEASRLQTSSALAELDQLLLERADEPTNGTDYGQLQQAREAAERLAGEQQRRVDELRRSVSPP